MAVYKQTYRRYDGPLTPPWSRFLVLARYAWQDRSDSRLLTTLLLASFVWPLICAAVIYLVNNLALLKLIDFNARPLPIDGGFFLTFLSVQSIFGFFLTALVGPGLIAPDLANNAMPLYLCRPFSRAEYVLGKLSALVILLSAVTWAPGLLLFFFQAALAGGDWIARNLWIAGAVFAGAWIWILTLSLLTLALSAWVKWKLAASGLLFGVFFVAAGFGHAVNGVMVTRWGHLLNLGYLMGRVWAGLFETARESVWLKIFGVAVREQLPLWSAWASLAAITAVCVWLLARKVRGCEVVR